MSKRIILTLAEDATNRICGTCRFLDGDRGGYCDAFSEYVKDETKRTRHNEIVNGLRLPECIAAEHRADIAATVADRDEWKRRAEAAERERDEPRGFAVVSDADHPDTLRRRLADTEAKWKADVQRLIALVESLTKERDTLKRHYDSAAPEHNLAALLDLYDEQRRDAILALEAACEERDADEHDLGGAFAAFFALVRTVEIRRLRARMEHYKRACITTSNEVTRVLGEALYGPNPDAWSTHTPEAIADEAASEIATLRAENERMRGEIITYQDAHTTGTEIIDELRAKVEALEPSDDVIELIRVAIDPDEPRLSGSCRAMVDVWLQRVEARKGGSDAE